MSQERDFNEVRVFKRDIGKDYLDEMRKQGIEKTPETPVLVVQG